MAAKKAPAKVVKKQDKNEKAKNVARPPRKVGKVVIEREPNKRGRPRKDAE